MMKSDVEKKVEKPDPLAEDDAPPSSNPEENCVKDFPMRNFEFKFSEGGADVSFNPLTSFLGIAVLWGLSIWCMVSPADALARLQNARSQVTRYFTWFFTFSRPFFVFFVLYVAIRYGNIKLGPKDAEPTYSNISYFAMLFSAGVAVGLFFFGVSEPLWYQTDNFFANAGYHSQDEIDMNAINQTLYHWGLAAWGSYVLVALAQALGTYRFGLPMTFRSSFYPLLGEYTWGWLGDCLDGFTIVTTVAGICTSLGLGAFQIVAGLQRLGWVDSDLDEDRETTIQAIIVWCITLVATGSVLSGLDVGIKYLSMFGFCLGMLLLFFVVSLERTNYLFNLMVQSLGYYVQHSIWQLSFWTDAFGQLQPGEGRAVDGNAAPAWFQDAWTIFYMAWWQAWSAFVGIFVARISYGRTIRDVVIYSLAAPVLYSIIWFGAFGGIGLRQARQAMELEVMGETYFNDTGYFLTEGSTYCYDVPQEDVYNGTEVIFTNLLPGITPVCTFNSAESQQAWFNVMYSFSFPGDDLEGFGAFLAILSLVAITIYFITSSDSGSLVVDHLASNGALKHHWIQRVFWAFTEGAVATSLLVAGGSDALQALQAVSIIFGLPFTLLVMWWAISIVRFCDRCEELGESNEIQDYVCSKKQFAMSIFGGILNWFEYAASMGDVHPERVEKGMDKPSPLQSSSFFVSLFLPFITLKKVLGHIFPKPASKNFVTFLTGLYAVVFVGFVVLMISGIKSRLFYAVAFSALFTNGCILTSLRQTVRTRFNIEGDIMGDFLGSTFFYPQVLVQLLVEYEESEGAGFNERSGDEANDSKVPVVEEEMPAKAAVEGSDESAEEEV